jgi:hypothetical protein
LAELRFLVRELVTRFFDADARRFERFLALRKPPLRPDIFACVAAVCCPNAAVMPLGIGMRLIIVVPHCLRPIRSDHAPEFCG